MDPGKSIVIVNYGMGNLGSIRNMLKKAGYATAISGDPEEIATATHLILPGVGHFGKGMEQLHALGLIPILEKKVLAEKTPVLGICLGMQLMAKDSEEASLPGLGWIDASFVRFRPEQAAEKIMIPHIGWNELTLSAPSRTFRDLPDPPRFYFVHSYHAVCRNPENVKAMSAYGYSFVAAYENENIVGVQFHPEKSHSFGMQLLKNFIENY